MFSAGCDSARNAEYEGPHKTALTTAKAAWAKAINERKAYVGVNLKKHLSHSAARLCKQPPFSLRQNVSHSQVKW